MMGVLYDVETHTVNYHLKKVFSDSELEKDSVIRNFRITAADGKNYNTKHYNLSAVIAVGYKVNSERAVQFRKWATTIMSFDVLKTSVRPKRHLQLLYPPHITVPLFRALQNLSGKSGFIQFLFGAQQTCSFGSRMYIVSQPKSE